MKTKYTPFELGFEKHCKLLLEFGISVEPLNNYNDYPKEIKYRL